MIDETQISAHVSVSTKKELERYAEAHGVKQGRLVEDALLHHLQALKELPLDVIIPTRIVVSRESGERILERLANPRPPTAAMKKLFSKK
ncbi:MAG: hypothetical protein ACOZIN_18675 [Myxococcota bacterium]